MPHWCSNYITIQGDESTITRIFKDLFSFVEDGVTKHFNYSVENNDQLPWFQHDYGDVRSFIANYVSPRIWRTGSAYVDLDGANSSIAIDFETAWEPDRKSVV